MAPVTQHEYDLHKETCGRSFDEILGKLQSIDNRLFRDNGAISVQTQIRINSEAIATVKRLTWIIVVAVVTVVAGVVMQIILGEQT